MKNSVTIFSLASLLFLLQGCIAVSPQNSGETKRFLQTGDPSIKVVEVHDKFAPGETMLASTALTVKDVTLFDSGFKLLEPRYYFSSQVRYYIFRWVYEGEGWGFYDEMILLINGEPYTAKPNIEPTREVLSGNEVMETVMFYIPVGIFEKIIAQDSVEIRVLGRMKYDFKLQGRDMAFLKTLKQKAMERDLKYGVN